MWQQEKKDGLIVSLVLSLAVATTPLAFNLFVSAPTLAETTPDGANFPLPKTVESGTTVRIDGSPSLVMINQSLKNKFENQFSGTLVELRVNGADTALKDLLDGKIDIAAIARDLTPEEKAQGLEQVSLHREKIAIIVGANNPFQGSLTPEQFAKIFRGEITDWSELGSQPGKIRLIDRPSSSDTRNSLREYSVFQSAEFSSGANTTQIAEDKTVQIIQQLGTDGISYVAANQVSKLPDVQVLKIKGFTPDNSQYPFSQPFVYVYKQNPNPGVASFLGFTLAPVGKEAIEAAKESEASAIAASSLQSFTPETAISSTLEAQPLTTTTPDENPTGGTTSQPETAPNSVNSGNEQPFVNLLDNNPIGDKNVIRLIGLSLLPIFGLGGFLAWWLKKKQPSADTQTDNLETSTSSVSLTETELGKPDDYSFLPPVENGNHTNGTSHLNKNTTSEPSNTEEYLTLTQEETLVGNLATATVQGTSAKANYKNHLDFSTETIALDCGEVVWDTEAPVAVVNTPYPSVPNISGRIPDVELLTDELTTSLSELLDNPAGTSAQDTSTPISKLLDHPAPPSHQDITAPLAELLDHPVTASHQNITAPLSELLDHSVPPSHQDITAPLAELLDHPTTKSEQDVSTSLSEIIGLPAPSPDNDSNTSLSELLGVGAISPNSDSTTTGLTSLNVSVKKSTTESITSLSELLGLPPEALDVEMITDETTNTLPALSEELGQLFNNLADETGIKTDLTPEELSSESSLSSMFAEDFIDDTAWKTDAETEVASASQAQTNIAEFASLLDLDVDSSIVFTPRTPKWAYVSWYVSETHKETLRQKGGTLLAVRLYDATDIDLSYQTPQLVQQYECEEATCDRYIAIPTSNRDYITEIGYVTNNNRWLPIARSGTIRIFNRPSGDFWFVTDTELVIHGSTEPGATVTIDGHEIKIQPDGTFNFRVPFSKNLLEYLMTATAAGGEQTLTILKKFSQENLES
ncbi:DUF4912 domain-containing protein [Sphaerospermopsis aphanizomenoides BCCUSP55]|uniref:substrate-binding domain-containing protein n=1 Tax=Sphaerospermopsis aphanizomenoides TaxID=459663 RepID=UPI00190483FA|nr:substrate-binding domain-containing protein [Sphaerospermopsis aphanizomenoides]MBK1990054.1 DUF4912 domain-containing protein [Sphaerospermopsis aphanizomenoides BCCUSP55]